MKIIDENGAAIENPALTLGYLVDDTEPVEHPAVEGVEEVSHYETVTEYPGGGRDVRKVIDVPGVPAQAAWTEQVAVQRYIRYTDEELAAREKERQQAEEAARLPETIASLTCQLTEPKHITGGGEGTIVLPALVKGCDLLVLAETGFLAGSCPPLQGDDQRFRRIWKEVSDGVADTVQ